jgi:hypothetical protein
MDKNAIMEKWVDGLFEVLKNYKEGLVSNTEAIGKVGVLSAMAADLIMNEHPDESSEQIYSALN